MPPPTAIVASGGGLNLYWALSEPIGDHDEIEARNRWLAQQLGADACWNCDRILRVPGTINWPNAKKQRSGRVPVLARLTEHCPERVYGFDDFGRVEASASNDKAESRPDRCIGDDTPLLTLDDMPAEVRDKLPAFACRLIREGPTPDEYNGDRSKAVLAVTCALLRAEASDSQIAGILLNPALPIHDHIRDHKGRPPRAYVARQIDRARDLLPGGTAAPPGKPGYIPEFDAPEVQARVRALKKKPAPGAAEYVHRELGDPKVEVPRLARLEPLAYDREREEAAAMLGCRVGHARRGG